MSEHADLRRIDALNAGGRYEEAAELAERAARAGPSLRVSLKLVSIYLRLGRYRDARRTTRQAMVCKPSAPEELLELCKRLLSFQFSHEVVQLASRQLAKPQWSAALEAELAVLLSMAGAQEIAVRLLDRATRSLGLTPASLYNRSQLHMYFGEADKAEADLRRCLQQDPRSAKAYWALGKLGSVLLSESELAALEALSRQGTQDPQNEVFALFALFSFHDRADRTEQAWAALERGCVLKRKSVDFDSQRSRQLFDGLVSEPFSGLPPATPVGADSGITPIFVVGMHRSGTTLLERILGGHSEVQEAGELYDFPAQLRWAIARHFNGPTDIAVLEQLRSINFPEVGKNYLASVAWRAKGHRFLVDKLPSNFLNVGYIRQSLPGSKVIHMRREAMDTCFSNLKELFSNACAYSYDQVELADYYAQYRRLMEHWKQVAPEFILDVSYEELARDPHGQAERILAFCGLDWEPGCIEAGGNARAVNTASSAQVREPIHQRGIGAWRRYQTHLGPLAARLEAHGLA